MHFSTAFFFSLATSLATAVIVPEGLPNGVHVVDTDEHGNHTFRFLGDYLEDAPVNSAKFRRQSVTPLPQGEMGCTGHGIPYSDLSGAQSQMYAYCGESAPIEHEMLTFTNGNAFTYSCRYTKSVRLGDFMRPPCCAIGEAC